MKLVTKRLILRPGTKKDIPDIVEGMNNINVSKWLLVVPYPYAKKDAVKWLNSKKKENKNLFIDLKDEKKVIGGIGLQKINKIHGTAEIGYWISEKYWKTGYGSEALSAVLKLAFEKLKLRRVNADVFAGNPSSGKLLEKFGGVQEGIKRKAQISKADGKIKDEIIYGILKEDWQKAVKKLEKK
jgi:[ribosomal protein S5]-alanine N-acetyltransferase